MKPFTGKLIWVFGLGVMLAIGGVIWWHYRKDSDAWMPLVAVGLILIITPLVMAKHNRDKAKREAADSVRPLRSPGERP